MFDVRGENFDRFTNNVGSEFTYQYLDSPDGRLTLRVIEYRAGAAGWPANAGDRVWEVMR